MNSNRRNYSHCTWSDGDVPVAPHLEDAGPDGLIAEAVRGEGRVGQRLEMVDNFTFYSLIIYYLLVIRQNLEIYVSAYFTNDNSSDLLHM